MGYVYKITNRINNKCYIGATIQHHYEARWRKHINSLKYKEGCPILKRAMLKHGVENFKFEILIICFDEDVVKVEKEYIKKYNCIQPNGYNILTGGQLGDGHVGFKHTPETIIKIKEAQKKFKEKNPNHYETYRERHQKTMKTINFSECVKKSEKFRKAMEERKKNYKNRIIIVSEETKEKIRKSVKEHYEKHGGWDYAKSSKKHMEGINRVLSKPVAQYTMEGIFVKEYISIAEAGRVSGVTKSNINQSLKYPKRSAGGYKWRYLPKDMNIDDSKPLQVDQLP